MNKKTMSIRKAYLGAALAAVIGMTATTSAVVANHHQKKAHHAQMDIVDTAVKSGQFKTLVKAVQTAGLVDTLKGKGPFTVFAPTDAAFAKLPAGTVEALLNDKEALTIC